MADEEATSGPAAIASEGFALDSLSRAIPPLVFGKSVYPVVFVGVAES
jgi:hypothetical protein